MQARCKRAASAFNAAPVNKYRFAIFLESGLTLELSGGVAVRLE
jgi:hypothetical protein